MPALHPPLRFDHNPKPPRKAPARDGSRGGGYGQRREQQGKIWLGRQLGSWSMAEPTPCTRRAHGSVQEQAAHGRSVVRAARVMRVMRAERARGAPAAPGVGAGLRHGLLFWNSVHQQSGMWEACITVPAHTTPAPSQHDQPLAFMSNNIHPKFSKRQKKKLQGDTRAQLPLLPSN